ncbi:MAG: hypothetical protein EB059_03715, partial [Alphaproteobacteria bacterium]|nr:hypothetical protein [Alphaproteobacteria bacterium]
MSALPPDQLQAIQAILAQQAPAQANEIAQSIAVTVQRSPIDAAALARAVVIDGTASQTPTIDQILLRTGQGDFLIRVPETARQQIQDNMPSRVTLQLRPGPNGLEAILVVGSKAAQLAGQVEQSLASSSALSRQTLTTEIPKVGQVFQVTVLPSTLLSNLLPGFNKTISQKANSFSAQATRTAINTQTTAEQTPATQVPTTSNLSTAKLSNAPLQTLNAASQTSRNTYEQGSTAGQQSSGQQLPQKGDAPIKLPLPIDNLKPQLLPLRIVNVATPDTLDVPHADKTFTAVVRGATPSGQPIISVDDQIAVVNTDKHWPVGTKIQVTLGAGAELVTDKEVKQLPTAFEGLREAIELLTQQNPMLINEVKNFRIPQAQSNHVSGAVLFFMVALQKGNMAAWLGEDVRNALEALGKQGLVQRMQEELLGSKQPAIDSAGSPWHGMTVPYLDGDKMQQFRFFVHEDHRQKQQKADRDIARRFLIDVSLSRLGPVQIDGLVHQKKLDLIVRTGSHLPEELRNDLRLRFQGAMEEIRYTGSLMFQANKQGWVDIKTRPN